MGSAPMYSIFKFKDAKSVIKEDSINLQKIVAVQSLSHI